MRYYLECRKCYAEYDSSYDSQLCGKCGSMLEVEYKGKLTLPESPKAFWDFSSAIPHCRYRIKNHALTHISHLAGLALKDETSWPTRSFKDRGSLVEISKAKEYGYKEIVCASTGNMALSLSYFAKLSGIRAKVYLSKYTNKVKIKYIRDTHNADVVLVEGDYTKAVKLAEEYSKRKRAFLAGDYCYRKEGQSTIGFEIALQSKGIRNVFVPVGNATLFSGIFKAYERMRSTGAIRGYPRLIAVQADGADALVMAFAGSSKIRYAKPHTAADGIAVGYPTYGEDALDAIRKTRGYAMSVSENEMTDAKSSIFEKARITAELAGASAVAAWEKISKPAGSIAIVTGANV